MEFDPWADYISRRDRDASSGAGRPTPTWTWNSSMRLPLPGRASSGFEDASSRSAWAMMQGGPPISYGPPLPQGRDHGEPRQSERAVPLLSTGTPQGNLWLGQGPNFAQASSSQPMPTSFTGPGTGPLSGTFGAAAWPGTLTTSGTLPFTSPSPPTTSHPWTSPSATRFGNSTPPQETRNGSHGAQMPNALNSAAAAASSLDYGAPPSTGKSVASAFEVLGLQAPHLRQPQVDQGERFIQAITGEKKNIPSWSGQPNTMRSWLKLLAYWESETTLARDRWGLRLYQSFPEGSQPRKIADQVPMNSEKGYGMILTALMAKYKPYLEVAGPTSIDKFFYTGKRGKTETFATYVADKEVARQEMESHLQERLCERVAGRVLLRHANLTEWQRELMALREQHQLLSFDQIAALLRPLDRPELLAQAAGAELGAQAAKHYPVIHPEDEGNNDVDEYDEEDAEEEESSESEFHEGEMLFEDREYEEDEALYIQAYHSAYADGRKDLNTRRKERGFVRRKGSAKEGGRSGKGSGKKGRSSRSTSRRTLGKGMMRGSAEDLQSRTRCFN